MLSKYLVVSHRNKFYICCYLLSTSSYLRSHRMLIPYSYFLYKRVKNTVISSSTITWQTFNVKWQRFGFIFHITPFGERISYPSFNNFWLSFYLFNRCIAIIYTTLDNHLIRISLLKKLQMKPMKQKNESYRSCP